MASNQILTPDGITSASSNTVSNLGINFDQDMSFNARIKYAGLFQLRNVSKIKNIQSHSNAEKLIHTFINSRLEYCN